MGSIYIYIYNIYITDRRCSNYIWVIKNLVRLILEVWRYIIVKAITCYVALLRGYLLLTTVKLLKRKHLRISNKCYHVPIRYKSIIYHSSMASWYELWLSVEPNTAICRKCYLCDHRIPFGWGNFARVCQIRDPTLLTRHDNLAQQCPVWARVRHLGLHDIVQ